MANGLSTGSGAGPGSPTTLAAFEQSLSQQLWHMCDDDKIKIMSQAEFEELLSPNRRHVITPYLLFYARYDLAPQKEMDATGLKGGSGDGGGGGPTCSVMID
ncbi:AAEL011290-PA [Aedes aegypti]|nr:AAEL011290-PA [Aedes aegypti]